MTDLESIKKIEQKIGKKLDKFEPEIFKKKIENDIFSAFSLNKQNNVVCFSLQQTALNDSIIKLITNLRKLKKTTFFDNGIKDYTFLKELTNLSVLNLNSAHLSDVSFLKELTNISVLDLSSNRDIKDYTFLKELTNLSSLDLSSNNLSDVSFLKELPNLSSLYLRDNNLSDVSFLKKLTNLSVLNLSWNRNIKDYSFLKKLRNLSSLSLSQNNLSDVYFIKELRNLSSLDLCFNKLTDVSFLKELPILNHVYLDDNPIKEPPPEIVEQGIEGIRNYYEQIKEKGEENLFEAKLLLVGEPAAGKTSLMKKMTIRGYKVEKDKEHETIGVNISHWDFNYEKSPSDKFFVNIWDFGGHEIQYHLHQFFLTPDSLYLLMSDDRDQRTNFDYWFEIISNFGEGSPVLVALNERLKKGNTDFEISNYKRFFDEFVIEHKDVDLANDGDGRYNVLIKTIQRLITGLDHVGKPLPQNWIPIRKKIDLLSKEKNHIKWKEFKEICESEDLVEESYQINLSETLKNLGIICHFKDFSDLADFIILNPQWAVDAIYNILSDKDVKEKQKGRFSKEWLFARWGDKYTFEEKSKLLSLMKKNKFDLIYEIKNSDKEEYIAPLLIPVKKPDFNWKKENNLRFRYRYRFMPKGIISHLIVRLNEYVDNENDQELIWENGVILKRNNVRAKIIKEIKKDGLKVLDIEISGDNKKEFLTIIREEIEKINNRFKNLNPEKLIPCNCEVCLELEEPEFFEHSRIEKYIEGNKQEIYCTKAKEDILIKQLLEGVVDEKRYSSREHLKYNREKISEDGIVSSLEKLRRSVDRIPETIQRVNKKPWWQTTGGIIGIVATSILIIWTSIQIFSHFQNKNENKQKIENVQESMKADNSELKDTFQPVETKQDTL